jgi:hypothetical protein
MGVTNSCSKATKNTSGSFSTATRGVKHVFPGGLEKLFVTLCGFRKASTHYSRGFRGIVVFLKRFARGKIKLVT